MLIVRRPLRPWTVPLRTGALRGQFVLTDPDHEPAAVFLPPLLLNGRRLHVDIEIAAGGRGSLQEGNLLDRPTFRVVEEPGIVRGTITVDLGEEGMRVGRIGGIRVEHDASAPPAWRCINLALATILPQLGVAYAVPGHNE